MGFLNSMQSSGNVVIVAGSFADNLDPQRGEGYTVTVGSGAFTITFDRQYDDLISCVATVYQPAFTSGEALVPVITQQSWHTPGSSPVVTSGAHADTDGGTITIKLVDDAGNIETSLEADIEVNFIAILVEDTQSDEAV